MAARCLSAHLCHISLKLILYFSPRTRPWRQWAGWRGRQRWRGRTCLHLQPGLPFPHRGVHQPLHNRHHQLGGGQGLVTPYSCPPRIQKREKSPLTAFPFPFFPHYLLPPFHPSPSIFSIISKQHNLHTFRSAAAKTSHNTSTQQLSSTQTTQDREATQRFPTHGQQTLTNGRLPRDSRTGKEGAVDVNDVVLKQQYDGTKRSGRLKSNVQRGLR